MIAFPPFERFRSQVPYTIAFLLVMFAPRHARKQQCLRRGRARLQSSRERWFAAFARLLKLSQNGELLARRGNETNAVHPCNACATPQPARRMPAAGAAFAPVAVSPARGTGAA